MTSSENHYKNFHNKGSQLPKVEFSALKNGMKGVAIGEEELFLAVERSDFRWKLRLYNLFGEMESITGWVSIKDVELLRTSPVAKPIREKLKENFRDDFAAVLEEIVAVVQDNAEEWIEDQASEGDGEQSLEHEGPRFSEEVKRKAYELLTDPAFFYKLGWVFYHGFMVPKINQPRFVVGEERNKRLVGLLLMGAAKLNMTSIIKLLGEPGTCKDTLIRMWLELLPLNTLERSFLTAASLRYSKSLRKADLLYIPDSPELRGEMGRHLRFMRADDGGLISEYAMRDPISGEMTTQVVRLPVKGVATTSNALTFDPALESGMWTLRTDESEELTRLVKEEKLRLRAGERPLFPEEELEVWRCAFHILLTEGEPEKIPRVPYAEQLIGMLARERSESRRDPDKLCDLISLVGWCRRFQKPEGEREATDLADLYIALQLGLDAITQTMSDLTDMGRRVYEAVKNKEGGVTCREVATEVGCSYKTCYRHLEKLVEDGWLGKDKEYGKNIYTVISQKSPKQLLIISQRNAISPDSLMEHILSFFGNFSLSHQHTHTHLLDPLTGDRIIVSCEGSSKPVVSTQKVVCVYPYEKVRRSEMSMKSSLEPEMEPKQFLREPMRSSLMLNLSEEARKMENQVSKVLTPPEGQRGVGANGEPVPEGGVTPKTGDIRGMRDTKPALLTQENVNAVLNASVEASKVRGSAHTSELTLPVQQEKPVWLWRRVPPGDKCELCGRWAVEYEVKDPISGEVLKRCEHCFIVMREMFKKAAWRQVETETIGSGFAFKLEDLKAVYWADEQFGEHECAVCGYVKMTCWKAETFKGEAVWICEDCVREWEKNREEGD